MKCAPITSGGKIETHSLAETNIKIKNMASFVFSRKRREKLVEKKRFSCRIFVFPSQVYEVYNVPYRSSTYVAKKNNALNTVVIFHY